MSLIDQRSGSAPVSGGLILGIGRNVSAILQSTKSALLVTLTLWALLLPALHHGGLLDHTCHDCCVADFCSHEGNCVDTSPAEILVRPKAAPNDTRPSPPIAAQLPESRPKVSSRRLRQLPLLEGAFLDATLNLPVFESDRPRLA